MQACEVVERFQKSSPKFGFGAVALLALSALAFCVLIGILTAPSSSSTELGPSSESSALNGTDTFGKFSEAQTADRLTRQLTTEPLSGGQASVQSGLQNGAQDGAQKLFVHIVGAVQNPGLYQMDEGARTIDLVGAAGGFLPEADPSQLNLAERIRDEQKVVVPRVGELLDALSSASGASQALVNLNTATQQDLESLPNVGPALAKRILNWRQSHGRFQSVEDLLGVSGIGPKTFEELRTLVTI